MSFPRNILLRRIRDLEVEMLIKMIAINKIRKDTASLKLVRLTKFL